eukprot:TRINITY_DN43214_c0_g1_i1.p1 TRINITY_DN43214_c0_g1~~TRINITY_DN43214_c0_g1_i1.p1  ORF type:complete len:174 (+),score=4.89 TRINITY_DN43214_c0_g1_i1:35-556(+)
MIRRKTIIDLVRTISENKRYFQSSSVVLRRRRKNAWEIAQENMKQQPITPFHSVRALAEQELSDSLSLPQVYQASVDVPKEVTVSLANQILRFDGPLGSNGLNIMRFDPKGIGAFKIEEGKILLASPSQNYLEYVEILLKGKIKGVMQGYLTYLQIQGIGYRVSKEMIEVPKK